MARPKSVKREESVESDDQYEYENNGEVQVSDGDIDSDQDEEEEYDEEEYENVYEDDEEEEEEDEQAKLAELKRNLAHVSFEQLAEIKSKMGMKEFSKARRGQAATESSQKRGPISRDQILKDVKGAVGQLKKTDKIKRTKEDMKRSSKHSPMEVTSKKAVGRFREVVPAASAKRRDPRFDKLSGAFNQDLFEKSYTFLDDYKSSEITMLREQLRKQKDPEEREKIQSVLTKMVSQESSAKEAKRKQQLARERKKTEAELVQQGKQPYFLKRSEKRKLELMDKYEKFGEKNMERILEKRRKKNAAKDHRRTLPGFKVMLLPRFLFGALATGSILLASVTAQAPKLTAYVTDWSLPKNIAWSKLDHINYAFGIPTVEGIVNGFDKNQLKQVVADAHKNNKTISLSVGGWTGSKYFSTLVHGNGSDTFSQTLVNLVEEYNLDGIDIDWEYPNNVNGVKCNKIASDDTANYLSLLQKLRKGFDSKFPKQHKYITVAAATSPFNDEYKDPSETLPKGWATVLDAVNIMVYDVNGGWDSYSGANAPLYAGGNNGEPNGDLAVKNWLNAGIPADRLVFGVPFYGHTTVVTRTMNGDNISAPLKNASYQIPGDQYDELSKDPCKHANASYSGEFQWRSIVSLNITNNQNGWKTFWDDPSKTPYAFLAFNKTLNDTNQFLSFDNPRSLEAKVNYVNQNKLGGIMIWSLEMDDQENTLLNSLQGVRDSNAIKFSQSSNKFNNSYKRKNKTQKQK
ncbi:hypothetical protein DFQ29_006284 [Apophysomyces sp. BC1021]|nr:hypothetical protein DFQ29_006284 [Apophysomyces sp. BC1021]